MKSFLSIIFSMLLLSCQAQENNKPNETPKGKWQVHKEFDENGNLIAYDSVYTYSSFQNKYTGENLDSIMKQFQNHFNSIQRIPWKHNFSFSPSLDSITTEDFFEDEFFKKSWEHQKFDIDKMLKEMDSIRNQFIKSHYKKSIKNQKTI